MTRDGRGGRGCVMALLLAVGAAIASPSAAAARASPLTSSTSSSTDLRYVCFNRDATFSPPVYSQCNPASFTPAILTNITDTLNATATGAPGQLQPCVSFLFSVLQCGSNTSIVRASVRALLAASLASGVPVFLGLDGQNWWDQSELWNWWDSTLPGYDPTNAANVERFSFSPTDTLKVCCLCQSDSIYPAVLTT